MLALAKMSASRTVSSELRCCLVCASIARTRMPTSWLLMLRGLRLSKGCRSFCLAEGAGGCSVAIRCSSIGSVSGAQHCSGESEKREVISIRSAFSIQSGVLRDCSCVDKILTASDLSLRFAFTDGSAASSSSRKVEYEFCFCWSTPLPRSNRCQRLSRPAHWCRDTCSSCECVAAFLCNSACLGLLLCAGAEHCNKRGACCSFVLPLA